MCGITASIALPLDHGRGDAHDSDEAAPNESLTYKLQASLEKIKHRGPDGSGVWVSPDGSVGLGHCRLAINDLSPSGAQPLSSDDGQIHTIVNGEIYDYDRLRDICAVVHGYKFQSDNDSELVLALYKIYGCPEFFKHLRGEFAFVLYDSRDGCERVIAGRDRFGIKPLFWTTVGDRILLASEAKAFLPLGWKPEWDVGAIMDLGWTVDDRTQFKDVKKLLPGHWFEISKKGLQLHRYWDSDYEDKTKPDTRSIDEMVIGVRKRLVEAVRLRLRADVPVGVYLSGGIDSSAIAGIVTQLARKERIKIGNQAATKVACFSVQFPEKSGFDESDVADQTAKWLGVETIKKVVDEATLADNFIDAAYHCEHSNLDLNFVAKFALSTLPQENGIKVVITGEGPDEHFAGYVYFLQGLLLEPDLSQPNSPLSSEEEVRKQLQKRVADELSNVLNKLGAATVDDDNGENGLLTVANGSSTAVALSASWQPSQEIFASWIRESDQEHDLKKTLMMSHSSDVRTKMHSTWHSLHTSLYMWNKSALPNLLLSALGDRVEMAHSVEGRTPFLDHHLTEYVNNLPPSVKAAYTAQQATAVTQQEGAIWKIAGSAMQSITEKWILREAVRPYITDEVYRRKKHPFLAPIKWPEKGPLHCMFEKLLTCDAVENLGFIDYNVVEQMLGRAFGDNADVTAFRALLCVGSWVALSQRLGVKRAEAEGYMR
ncbi:asparagine synthase (glutamine-hydrolyzing) [Emergomyces pasteurianus Ep9510]|uniref:Asparagine synthase (Glutamine-hydrolyzing) n=1 Tax=Emergomyces pasteurianus Ep9510 TaxID=1447872 RepID=A0A1J9PR25_9EURO|nr:asparagine synthase (glutamine-hydrolyzing) [Emergomyces pasteurianus Ep9510]